MGRSPCCEKIGLKKGPWTQEEDQKLMAYIEQHGHGSWRALPAKAGLQRCGKSCRLRWTNYLRPDIKRGKFSLQEEQTIIQLHALLGNRWSAIATHLPKRTDNEIKNYWNTHLKKRLTKMGIDPVTHKPRNDTFGSGHSKDTANISHMAQWESARLEAEARLVRESKLASNPACSHNQNGPLGAVNKAVSHSPPLPCLDILKVWQSAWSKPSGLIDDLESPTSTLSFIDSPIPISAIGFNYTSTGALEIPANLISNSEHGISKQNGGARDEWKGMNQKLNPTTLPIKAKSHDHQPSPLQDTVPGAWVGVPSFRAGESDAASISSVMDGLSEIFAYDRIDQDSSNMVVENPNNVSNNISNCANVSCSGDESEENKSYWNTIFNLVTASPGSPVF